MEDFSSDACPPLNLSLTRHTRLLPHTVYPQGVLCGGFWSEISLAVKGLMMVLNRCPCVVSAPAQRRARRHIARRGGRRSGSRGRAPCLATCPCPLRSLGETPPLRRRPHSKPCLLCSPPIRRDQSKWPVPPVELMSHCTDGTLGTLTRGRL